MAIKTSVHVIISMSPYQLHLFTRFVSNLITFKIVKKTAYITIKTNKRQRKPKGQSRIGNPERNWPHWVHKTQDEDNQRKKHNTEN